jgi:hypothetical protein
MLNTTPVEHLKLAKTNSVLNREDWKLLKSIYTNEQTTFRPCDCKQPCKSSSLFSIEASKTFTESNHPAVGLGELKTTFKCNGCRKSFNAVSMLLRYQEQKANLSPSTLAKRQRVLSPAPNTSQQSSLWLEDISPDMVADPLVTQTSMTRLTNNNSNIEAKLDKLTDIISELTRKSINDSEHTQNILNRLMNSVDSLATRNQYLESRLDELTQRLIATEDKLKIPIDSNKTQSQLTNSSSHRLETSEIENQTAPQPSWATIAKLTPPERSQLSSIKAKVSVSRPDRIDGFNALSILTSKRLPPKRKPETGQTIAVYFSGFEFQKLRNIWSALKKAKFQASRIVTIQWIGRTVLEFVIDRAYEDQFVSELTASKDFRFRLIQFDPTKNTNAVTEEQSETALRSFSIRCVKNVLLSENIVARNHFQSLAEKACLENPMLKTIYETEYNRCKQQLETEEAELIEKLTMLGAGDNPDYHNWIRRLRLINPSHDLVIDYLRMKALADSEPSEALAVGNQ